MPAVIPACEIGVVQSTKPSALCRPTSRPWVIAAASLGSGMAFLDSTVMNVTLPAVQAELGASAQEVQWSYGAFALVLSALILVGGTLGDRFGRRRLFVIGAAIFGGAPSFPIRDNSS
jgi:MFS family permease